MLYVRYTCIDLIVTDQLNLVLNSGVRDSLDATVKHKIVFCKINFKIPPPPKYLSCILVPMGNKSRETQC